MGGVGFTSVKGNGRQRGPESVRHWVTRLFFRYFPHRRVLQPIDCSAHARNLLLQCYPKFPQPREDQQIPQRPLPALGCHLLDPFQNTADRAARIPGPAQNRTRQQSLRPAFAASPHRAPPGARASGTASKAVCNTPAFAAPDPCHWSFAARDEAMSDSLTTTKNSTTGTPPVNSNSNLVGCC